MKRIIVGLLTGMLLLFITGCGAEQKAADTGAVSISGENQLTPTAEAAKDDTDITSAAEGDEKEKSDVTPETEEPEPTPTAAEDDEEEKSDVTPETEEPAPIPTAAEGDKEEKSDVTSETEETVSRDSIAEMLKEHGILAGTCLSDQMVRNTVCTEIITSQFNSITFENLLKPDYILDRQASIASGQLVVSFEKNTIQLLDWVQEKGMELRGHTLVWYSQTPSWIFYDNFTTTGTLVDRDTMLARMDSYISQVFSMIEEYGYTDLFYAYDIVNEALMEDGTMRSVNNLWYQIIGEDYVWHAFYYADKYAPESIELFYNDYNEQYKTDTIVKLVNTLKDDSGRSLIDGIGLQAHLYTGDNLEGYLETMERLGETGLKLQVTELDVGLGSWQNRWNATDENLKLQGQYYYNLIAGILQLKEEKKIVLDSITIWGFADSLSWRKEYSPLLYDSKYEPKYSYYGVLQQKEKSGF